MTKIARLYYEQGLRQTEIVERLKISQTTVSRLLQRARQEGIVRITIAVPPGVHPELEEALQQMYGLQEVVVVDSMGEDDEQRLLHDIGAAAAYYLETTLKRKEIIGISSWSKALLAMMDTMAPMKRPTDARVVQILGGIGNPAADMRASQLTLQFAEVVRGEPTFLPAPAAVRSADNRRFFLEDKFVREAMELFPRLTLALVGIGGVGPSRKLSSSGVVFSEKELAVVRKRGAVGDICLRFYDRDGNPIVTALDHWVVGIELEQLRQVKRRIGVAGGRRKVAAIRGALKGGWINGLITDRFTAERLAGASR